MSRLIYIFSLFRISKIKVRFLISFPGYLLGEKDFSIILSQQLAGLGVSVGTLRSIPRKNIPFRKPPKWAGSILL